MSTLLPSSGAWETTACSCLSQRAALMASRSSSDSAGEHSLDMNSSADDFNDEGCGASLSEWLHREVLVCSFEDFIDFTVHGPYTQLCFLFWVCRNCKPRNRPSFRQILLHLDIASADVLSTPQETYFKSQVWLLSLLLSASY